MLNSLRSYPTDDSSLSYFCHCHTIAQYHCVKKWSVMKLLLCAKPGWTNKNGLMDFPRQCSVSHLPPAILILGLTRCLTKCFGSAFQHRPRPRAAPSRRKMTSNDNSDNVKLFVTNTQGARPYSRGRKRCTTWKWLDNSLSSSQQ